MKTLTANEWNMIFALPTDGKTYHVEGVAFRAKHLPRTSIRLEQVIVDSGKFGLLRRRKVNEKWQATEQLGGRYEAD